MVKKKISIIIPNFNSAKLLEKNLPKVILAARNYDKNTEIIVVDDGSYDKSREVIKRFLEVKLITKEKNEGFSSTCNTGVERATGEIVVLLNTDVWPEKDFLLNLAPHFNNPNIFAVGCLDKSLENGKEIKRGRGIGWFKRGFLVHSRGEVDKNNTLWVSGGSSAFDKNKWIALGGFDKIYNPFYWEDIDLSYRAQKCGYLIFFEPLAVVHHNHEEGAIKKKYNSGQIKTIAYRNQFIFVWKNITDSDLLLKHLLWLPYHFLKFLLAGDFSFFNGFLSALLRLSRILIRRLYYYRTTALPVGRQVRGSSVADKEILAQFANET